MTREGEIKKPVDITNKRLRRINKKCELQTKSYMIILMG